MEPGFSSNTPPTNGASWNPALRPEAVTLPSKPDSQQLPSSKTLTSSKTEPNESDTTSDELGIHLASKSRITPPPESANEPDEPISNGITKEAEQDQSSGDVLPEPSALSQKAAELDVRDDALWSPVSLNDDLESADGVDPAWGVLSSPPPLDHTNSFPTVPPAPQKSSIPTHALPHSQAGEILDEIEHSHDDIPFGGEAGSVEKNEDDYFGDLNYVKSETKDVPFDKESRFEEGVPLVSKQSKDGSSPAEPSGHQNDVTFDSSFGGGEDDFFTQLSSPPHDNSSIVPRQGIDRKSTDQVMASLNHSTKDEKPMHIFGIEEESETLDFEQMITSDSPVGSAKQVSSSHFNPPENGASGEGDVPTGNKEQDASADDLAAKWEAALGDDDLLEDETGVDPSSFFDDDGGGFLNDDHQSQPAPDTARFVPENAASNIQQTQSHMGSAHSSRWPISQSSFSSPIAGSGRNTHAAQYSPYAPNHFAATSQSSFQNIQPPNSAQPPQRPSVEKAQSFADKSKGGYSSPYDAPMDLSRPKRRPAPYGVQTFANRGSSSVPAPPPRSSSVHSNATGPPQTYTPTSSIPSQSPGVSSLASPANPGGPQLQPKASTSSFFEDLQAKPKPRTQSSSGRPGSQGGYAPQYSQFPPQGPPPPPSGPPRQSQSTQAPQIYGLVGPERVLPFSDTSSQNFSAQAPPPSTRYSPAPTQSPNQAPNQNRYAAAPGGPPPGPPQRPPSVPHMLPFQPRTSSPLARSASASQQEISAMQADFQALNEGSHIPETRRPSLKSTQTTQPHPVSGGNLTRPAGGSRSSTYHHPLEQSQILSPDDRTFDRMPDTAQPPANIASHLQPSAERPRASLTGLLQEQSPQSSSQPPETYSIKEGTIVPQRLGGTLGQSHSIQEFIRPTDGRENDPLERWRGAPIFNFGFGGNIVTSFPQRIPRYATGQRTPMMKCSPGEVKVHGARLLPLDDHISTFPGPLTSKNKKKDVLTWLQKRIEKLQQLPISNSTQQTPADARKRHDERILLWKILHVLVEHDGSIDSNPSAENAVRSILSPELAFDGPGDQAIYGAAASGTSSDANENTSNRAGPSAIEALRKFLFKGDREKAVWHAVDQRLWGHAMIIASTLPSDVWKQVSQEFVRHDVKPAGINSEPLAALYDVFAGNWEESVDELVPPSARAGLQMLSKSVAVGSSKNALEGLDRWRETLSLILSNRSVDDTKSMVALGQLLSNYGRIEAAHICFVFSKVPGLFAGPDDPQAGVVLLGANHRQQPIDYAKDFDNLLLTEVYEYAYAILSPSAASTLTPHLQAFKLYHAEVLSEYGMRDEAQQYCDAIGNTLRSTTKMSPYYHPRLFGAVEELNSRLRQSPKDGSGSWITRPSIDKVSGSVWNKFTQFVAGDESDSASVASGKPEADGPFAAVSGGTPPTISRGPSPVDGYAPSGATGAYLPNAAPTRLVNSRYAPTSYTPVQPPERIVQPNLNPVPSFAEGGRSLPTPSTQASDSPELHSQKRQNPAFPPTKLLLGNISPTLSRQDDSRPSTGYEPIPPLQEARLSPNEVRHKPFQPSPSSDRHSPSYEPRSSSYEPRSASYDPRSASPDPRSASYEPRSASYEPRSYVPSPRTEKTSQQPAEAPSTYEPHNIGDGAENNSAQSSYTPAPSYPGPSYQPSLPTQETPSTLQPPTSETSALDAPSSSPNASAYEPLSSGHEPPTSGYGPPTSGYQPPSTGYEPPTSGYEPPAYNADANGDPSSPPNRDDSDDDDLAARAAAARRAENDRIAAENVRRAAEADAQRDTSSAPSGGWFSRILRGGRSAESVGSASAAGSQNRPIRARLGEESSFYYDKDLKKWVNKKVGTEAATASAPTPPPPKGPPTRATSQAGPPPANRTPSGLAPPPGPGSRPPSGPSSRAPSPSIGGLTSPLAPGEPSTESPPVGGAPAGPSAGVAPNVAPPSRPGTGMSSASNASAADDLYGGPPQARRGGTMRKGGRKGRYVDVLEK